MIPLPPPTAVSVHQVPALPNWLTHELNRVPYLENPATAAAVFVTAGVVIVLWVGAAWLRRRRRRRLLGGPLWLARTGLGLLSTVLVLLGAALEVNAYAGYVPSIGALLHSPGHIYRAPATRHTRVTKLSGAAAIDYVRSRLDHLDRAGSQVVGIDIGSRADRMPSRPAFVYLPPGYGAPANRHRRYPTVYLIEGFPGGPADWFTAGQLQRTMDVLLRDHYVGPMIVVSPSDSTGYFTDYECLNQPGGIQVEDYLSHAVVDAVDRTFRTIPLRTARAIGGMSSGAYCALNIGLQHLQRFSVILATEPYGTPGSRAFHQVLHGNRSLLAANSPSSYLSHWHFTQPVAVLLAAGRDDRRTRKHVYSLADQLAADGQYAAVRVASHEKHTWREARVELPYDLVFAWRQFVRACNAGTSCASSSVVR